ncbi:MAG: hypothetical protein ACREVQ_16795 [Burkholderiales bacterium]
MLTAEEKLDLALEGTFPASDPFYLPPDASAAPEAFEQTGAPESARPVDRRS